MNRITVLWIELRKLILLSGRHTHKHHNRLFYSSYSRVDMSRLLISVLPLYHDLGLSKYKNNFDVDRFLKW